MPQPLESPVVSYQKLATPDISVRAVTGTIKGNTDNPLLDAILHHTTHNMGMVMLNRDQFHILVRLPQRFSVFGRQVFRMHIIGHYLGFDAKQLLVELERGFKVLHSLHVLHIAYMLADKSIVIPCEAECVLQLRPAGQDLPRIERKMYGKRSITPGSSHQLSSAQFNHGDAVIITGVDVSVVD